MQTAPAGDFALFAGKSLAEASQALWGWQLRMPDGATRVALRDDEGDPAPG